MDLLITLPDEYQPLIDVVLEDTEKQNPDRDDVCIEGILVQVCRKFVVETHAQIMMNLPATDDLTASPDSRT